MSDCEKKRKERGLKPCPANKICNPETGFCVKRNGKIGKKLLGKSKTKRSKSKSRRSKSKTRRSKSKTQRSKSKTGRSKSKTRRSKSKTRRSKSKSRLGEKNYPIELLPHASFWRDHPVL